jgi:hypothetical protein
MTFTEVVRVPATSPTRDLIASTPVALLRAMAAALAVAAIGQVPPSLVNVAGGGLAVQTQLRVGWLYTMAGHAVSIDATGSGGSVDGLGGNVVSVRLGMLTIAAVAAAMLVAGARATARRVDDVGARRIVAGALLAVPYAALIGGVNANVGLRLDTGGGLLPDATTFAAPVWEGFVLPGTLALVAGAIGGWSVSESWRRSAGRAVRAGALAFLWTIGLSFVGLLVFATLRPEGLERYSVEMWSAGPQRAALYIGHQALLLPDQAMWVLAPSMGACVSLRVDEGAHDVLCLDRIPRAPDPATWLLSELGRVDGSPPLAPMPWVVWLFVAVPTAAILLGFHRLGRWAPSLVRAAVRGLVAGGVFAALVTTTALAGSLWLGVQDGDAARSVALGPDPEMTAVLALAWGLVGGVIVSTTSYVSRRLNRRG